MAQSEERTVAGTAPAGRLGQFSWMLFDWANQRYFTLITTFIFAPYFTATVVGDSVRGQELWGYALALAGLIIAVGSPLMGAVADASGPRKPWIAVFQAVSIAACAALWIAVPDASPGVLLAVLALIVVASVGAEFSIVFNNAMLPSLTSEARLGRLSGRAWALGYLGGLVSLACVLTAFSLAETPLFGLDKAAHEHDRVVGPLTAAWIAVFILPLFLFTPDAPPSGLGHRAATRAGLARLWATVKSLSHFRNVLLFLVARMLYFDGLSAVFAFGGIYAAGIFGWTTTDLGLFGIILTVFAAVGAFLGGSLDDRIGSKPTIMISVVGLMLATLGVLSISVDGLGTPARVDTILFVIPIAEPESGGGLFATTAERVFLLFGIMLGVCGGPAQAASRTMVSRLVPPDMVTEFYGLYALSGKATAFLAPFCIAVVTGAFNSQRAGISVILVFLVLGFLLMLPVREQRTHAVGH